MTCIACSGKGSVYLEDRRVAYYEGNELVVDQLVEGTIDKWITDIVRIKCKYCSNCGRKLEELEE